MRRTEIKFLLALIGLPDLTQLGSGSCAAAYDRDNDFH